MNRKLKKEGQVIKNNKVKDSRIILHYRFYLKIGITYELAGCVHVGLQMSA